MKIVRFVRKDDQPVEEYYYRSLEDAQYHFSLFLNDDSGLYREINLTDVETNLNLQSIYFN